MERLKGLQNPMLILTLQTRDRCSNTGFVLLNTF